MPRFPWMLLLVLLAVAAVGRGLLLATGSVSFHSDEAVVGLMARHMLRGDVPTFFYGQDYMGSLNAFPTAAAFAVLGEGVASMRAAAFGVYLVAVGTNVWAGWHLSHRRVVAGAAGLALAVPVPVAVIYTATNIGSYTETLILSNLILILGYDVTVGPHRFNWPRWVALGGVTGVGWWAHGLVIATALPVAVLAVWVLVCQGRRGAYLGRGVVGLGMFLVGGAPWWAYNLANNWAAARVYLSFGADGFETTFLGRLVGLVLLGLPGVVGMRYTWLAYFAVPVGVLVLVVYAAAFYTLARADTPPTRPGALALVVAVPVGLVAVFLVSSFGADPTGRYLLPMVVPLGVVLGAFAEDLRGREGVPRGVWVLPLALVVGYNVAGTVSAVRVGDPGFTTQFNLQTHAPNTHDAELIDWLLANDLHHGYTHYWLTYRLAFLSGERLQYATALSYREGELLWDGGERYPPYAAATAASERRAYITWDRLPGQVVALDAALTAWGLAYETRVIGPFVVFYDFDRTPPPPTALFQ